jgi:selenocysteine lyase/cysteine desulfurase
VTAGPDWDAVRAEFPALAAWTYLNTATYGQLPRRGRAALDAHFAHRDAEACTDFIGWYDEADRIRETLATLVGARAGDIAFVPNASTALGIVAAGLDWRAGDNAIVLRDEFPNQLYLGTLLERHGVTVRTVPWERLLETADARTRLVAFSEVNYVTGVRPPLATIVPPLRARGVRVFVDGTQSVGALRFDWRRTPVDVLAVHAYKWMISPTGAGFMLVAPELRSFLPPQVAGWRSDRGWRNVDDLEHGDPTLAEPAERYEGGGLAFGLLHALGAAAGWMLELGPETIERRVLALAGQVRARLTALGAEAPDTGSQIVAATFPGRDPSALAAALRDARVAVAARHGFVRISPHFYNTEADVDRLADVLQGLVA